jgi:hypothetical protein
MAALLRTGLEVLQRARLACAATGSHAADLTCVSGASSLPNIGAFFGVAYRLSYR